MTTKFVPGQATKRIYLKIEVDINNWIERVSNLKRKNEFRKNLIMFENILEIKLKKIGVIKTPYIDDAPYQPIDEDKGEFCVVVDDEYVKGLVKLEKFRYIYVIYYLDRAIEETPMIVNPAWVDNERVGLFASRAPERPNPIGLSVVKVKKIEDNKIFTSGLDVFDNTPLLDIKPYVKDLDSKEDSNYGWVENLKGNMEHLLLHIKGIPH